MRMNWVDDHLKIHRRTPDKRKALGTYSLKILFAFSKLINLPNPEQEGGGEHLNFHPRHLPAPQASILMTAQVEEGVEETE